MTFMGASKGNREWRDAEMKGVIGPVPQPPMLVAMAMLRRMQ